MKLSKTDIAMAPPLSAEWREGILEIGILG